MGGLGGGLWTPTSTPKRCPGGGTDLSRYPTLLPYMVYERVDRTPTLPGNFRGPTRQRLSSPVTPNASDTVTGLLMRSKVCSLSSQTREKMDPVACTIVMIDREGDVQDYLIYPYCRS